MPMPRTLCRLRVVAMVAAAALGWPQAGVAGAAPASLFRSLLEPSGEVPFPIGRLLERIRGELATEGAPFGGVPLVLIPLGRSLQRHAAGDDGYFRFPRVVIAVTGEPRDVSAPLLRDRLYLGYHEKAGVLEVISYNPGLGRFEFELVDDYRPGGMPRLRAGNRPMCLACHQNEAPLFARQTWDETSASPRIASLLALTGKDYYGLPWRRGVDVANAIDEATDRANLLAMAQRVWQSGCGEGPAGIDCRARLWWLALLSRFNGLPVADAALADAPLAPLRRHWQDAWRGTIDIPNPDIPNRLPFAALPPEAGTAIDVRTLRRAADVSARFDALALRPPLASWAVDGAGSLAQVVAAIGGFLSQAEVEALASRLAGRQGLHTRLSALECRREARGGRQDYRCQGRDGVELAARLAGDRLHIDRLALPGGQVRYGLDFDAAGGRYLRAGPPARDADGAALDSVAVAGGQLQLEWREDLAPLAAAVQTLAADSQAGRSTALAGGTLRRDALLAPLLAAFGLPVPPPPTQLPPLDEGRAAAPSTGAAADAPELLPFFRRCGACHDVPDAFPPGFLRGAAAAVRGRVDACAPRMLRRLEMWSLAAESRDKTPMPPPASIQAGGFAGSTELAQMRSFLAGRLRVAGLDPDRLAATAYADLPACAVY